MKTTTAPLHAPPATRAPDLNAPPKRLKLEQTVTVHGHGQLHIRPIQPDDEERMIHFHERVSEESVHMRYFEYLGLDRRTAHERLVRICTNTPESYALVVEKPATMQSPAAILAVGRLTKTVQPYVVTFDTLLTDEADIPKLGKVLLHRLVSLAHALGFQRLTGELLVDDHDALNLCRSLGFALQTVPQDGIVLVALEL